MKFLVVFLYVFLAGIQKSHGRTYPAPLNNSDTPEHVMLPGMRQNSNVYGESGKDFRISPRIVGGTEAEKHEFPWVVVLEQCNSGGCHLLCAASVIDQWWVMTAAHCAQNPTNSYRIVAGEHDLTEQEGTEQHRKVQTIISHPQWTWAELDNDIALMKLSKPLELDGKTVSPISLPSPQTESSGDCVVTGWGHTEENGDDVSDVLMKVTVPLVTDEECRNMYGEVPIGTLHVSDSMICAGYSEGGKSSCQGDSGGSLVCQGPDNKSYVAGVVSWGYGCARPAFPGVYTQVSYFIDWINEAMTQK